MKRLLRIAFVAITLANFCYAIEPIEKICETEKGFLERWNDFVGDNREFPLWSRNWEKDDLRVRFDQMLKERWDVYFNNPEDFGKKDVFGSFNFS